VKLLYKARATTKQLGNRIDMGNENMELHTEEDDLVNFNRTLNTILVSGADIHVVHAPIVSRHTIEGCLLKENRDVIRSACKLGQMLSDVNNHTVDIVLHQELELFQMEGWGIYNRILSFVEELLNRYPRIRINFENPSPIVRVQGKVYLTNSYYSGPVDLAIKLREDIGSDRIGVVWDSCHSMNSIIHLGGANKEGFIPPFTIYEHLKLFLPYMNVLHLSNAKNWGFGEEHGMNFESEEDKKVLHKILNILIDHQYSGFITMETNDEDVDDAKRQSALQKSVEEYLKANE
jgi:hypothetical protein